MGKIYIEMTVRNNEKAMDGHIFFYDPDDAKQIKIGDIIPLTIPGSSITENCSVIQKSDSKDTKSGSKGIMIHFERK